MASLSPHSKGLVSSEALNGCINLAESIYQNQISLSTLRLPGLKAVACSGLTLHFDRLSVLSLPKEATLLYPPSKAGLGAAEWVNDHLHVIAKHALHERPGLHCLARQLS